MGYLMNAYHFLSTHFSLLTLICILFLSLANTTSIHAEVVNFVKEYTYEANEADSKISCRAIAIEQVKRLLLEELGTYLESETEVGNFQLTKDKVIVLTASIVKVEILEEEWNGVRYRLKAKVATDTDELSKCIEALRKDRQKIKELEETRKRADELLQEVDRLKRELALVKSDVRQEQKKEYVEKIKQLEAIDLFEQGYSSSVSGDYTDAVESFDKAIEINPQLTAAYNNRGVAYASMGNYNLALSDYNKVIILNPSYAPAYLNRGIAFFNLGNYSQAMQDYNRAIRLDANYVEAYFQRGALNTFTGDYRKALDDFNKTIRLNPSRADAYRNRGDEYSRFGRQQDAMKDYERAYVIDSQRYRIGHHAPPTQSRILPGRNIIAPSRSSASIMSYQSSPPGARRYPDRYERGPSPHMTPNMNATRRSFLQHSPSYCPPNHQSRWATGPSSAGSSRFTGRSTKKYYENRR